MTRLNGVAELIVRMNYIGKAGEVIRIMKSNKGAEDTIGMRMGIGERSIEEMKRRYREGTRKMRSGISMEVEDVEERGKKSTKVGEMIEGDMGIPQRE